MHRFWTKVNKTTTCWNWEGAVDRHGYGRFRHEGTNWLPHRLAYTVLKGGTPPGKELDHTCQNKLCVNPDHLQAVTRDEHVQTTVARRTTCMYGHEFTPDNTYITRTGARSCRTCTRMRKWGK